MRSHDLTRLLDDFDITILALRCRDASAALWFGFQAATLQENDHCECGQGWDKDPFLGGALDFDFQRSYRLTLLESGLLGIAAEFDRENPHLLTIGHQTQPECLESFGGRPALAERNQKTFGDGFAVHILTLNPHPELLVVS